MNVVVYCSSADNLPADWQAAAAATGRWIGQHGAQLVYGGVSRGLMEIVAEAAQNAGARVVGVVPARRFSAASSRSHVKVPTNDLSDRKATMQILGDVYVALPGGYGTLDELASTIAYLNFTRQSRPVIVFNPDGLYEPLLQQYARMAALGLMPKEALDIIVEVHSLPELTAALERAAKPARKK